VREPDRGQRQSWASAIRGFDRNVYLLFTVAGLLGFTYWGITYLLTNLFVRRLGYGTEVMGNLNFLGYIIHMAASVPAGAIGVRFGNRRSMISGGIMAIAGWGMAPVAAFLPGGGVMETLVASRVLSSIGGAIFLVNSNPALMSAAGGGSSTYAFAFNGTIVSLTSFGGSLIGGLLPQLFSSLALGSLSSPAPYGFSLWTAVVILIPGLVALSMFREAPGGEERGRASVRRFPLGIVSVIALIRFLREMGYGGVLNFYNVYLDEKLGLPTALVGLLVSVSSIAAIVFTPLMPVMAKRRGTGPVSLVSLLVMMASVVPLSIFPHWAAAALGWAGMTAANSINEAAMQVYILQIVTSRWRPLMSGVANMATTLGLAFSAVTGGYLIRGQGYSRTFAAAAGFLLASSVVFLGHLAAMRVKGERPTPHLAN
jgi:MFS family permease